MFKKRLVSLLLALFSIFTPTVIAFANETDMYELPVVDIEEYQTVSEISSDIIISGTKATCISEATGLKGVTNISVTQTLQKKYGNDFSNVSGASWSTSVNNRRIIFSNDKSGLSSGTYRVKSVFTIVQGSTTETITSYSYEATI